MNKILETLETILILSKDYEIELSEFETDFKRSSMSNVESINLENQIKGQSYAFGLLRSYISNQIAAINQFNNKWTTEQQVRYLINFDSHGLTNGKFYDYAVGHYMWREKQPKIYNLIELKIQEYCELERKLKFEFRDYIAKNYESTIWFYPSKLIEIIKKELECNNQIIESVADKYFEYKLFFKFKYEFSRNYNNMLEETSYRKLEDIKYWNEEYQDYFMVVASGFEVK